MHFFGRKEISKDKIPFGSWTRNHVQVPYYSYYSHYPSVFYSTVPMTVKKPTFLTCTIWAHLFICTLHRSRSEFDLAVYIHARSPAVLLPPKKKALPKICLQLHEHLECPTHSKGMWHFPDFVQPYYASSGSVHLMNIVYKPFKKLISDQAVNEQTFLPLVPLWALDTRNGGPPAPCRAKQHAAVDIHYLLMPWGF